MHAEWNPGALKATLAAMQDEGLGQSEISAMADVNRSQVNRWARGENRPTYDRALRLARRTARRWPELAARFMAASGYAWDGQPEPEPGADVVAERVRKALSKTLHEEYPKDEADRLDAIIDAALEGRIPPRRRGVSRSEQAG